MGEMGKYKGFFYRRERIKNMIHGYEGRGNPLLWYASEVRGKNKARIIPSD
jgi:hypothetical protein